MSWNSFEGDVFKTNVPLATNMAEKVTDKVTNKITDKITDKLTSGEKAFLKSLLPYFNEH